MEGGREAQEDALLWGRVLSEWRARLEECGGPELQRKSVREKPRAERFSGGEKAQLGGVWSSREPAEDCEREAQSRALLWGRDGREKAQLGAVWSSTAAAEDCESEAQHRALLWGRVCERGGPGWSRVELQSSSGRL